MQQSERFCLALMVLFCCAAGDAKVSSPGRVSASERLGGVVRNEPRPAGSARRVIDRQHVSEDREEEPQAPAQKRIAGQ